MLDNAHVSLTGRLAGRVTWLPIYDKGGNWMPRTDSKGNVINGPDGKPLPSGRAIYTLAINNTGKKADGSENPPTYVTIVDWSYGRFQNFYRKYFPEGTEVTLHCDVRSFKKDHGSQYPDHVRYHLRTQFVVQRMFPGNRSKKGAALDTYTCGFKKADGSVGDIKCSIKPVTTERTQHEVGNVGSFEEAFGEMSGEATSGGNAAQVHTWLGDVE